MSLGDLYIDSKCHIYFIFFQLLPYRVTTIIWELEGDASNQGYPDESRLHIRGGSSVKIFGGEGGGG